jgi:hypothetical protein
LISYIFLMPGAYGMDMRFPARTAGAADPHRGGDFPPVIHFSGSDFRLRSSEDMCPSAEDAAEPLYRRREGRPDDHGSAGINTLGRHLELAKTRVQGCHDRDSSITGERSTASSHFPRTPMTCFRSRR